MHRKIVDFDAYKVNMDAKVRLERNKARVAKKKLGRVRVSLAQNIEKVKEAKIREDLLLEQLVHMQRINAAQAHVIQQYKEDAPRRLSRVTIPGRKGAAHWEVWVVQLICELLVIGAPPATIPKSINTIYETLIGKSPDSVPGVDFVRKCRVVVQNIAETMAAIKLASADEWAQLSTDATTRRHLPFQCLIISLLGEDMNIIPVIVSSCIFLDNETAETTVSSLFDKVCHMLCLLFSHVQHQLIAQLFVQLNSLKQRLIDVRQVLSDNGHDVDLCPHPDSISEDKARGIAVTTDNCNTARSVKRKINARLGDECTEIDCHNHLRNTYLCNAVEKALSKFLTAELKESLDKIDARLWVSTLWLAFARAFEKEFSLALNYPKGHGAEFLAFVKQHFVGSKLFAVESTHGGRQDIVLSSSMAMYLNRCIGVAFLNFCLCIPNRQNNILQRNLFVLMTSAEMVAQSRLLAIINISIMLPLRWLAGKTHELHKYEWGALSMGWALDILHEMLIQNELWVIRHLD